MEIEMTPFDRFLNRRGFLYGTLALGASAASNWFTRPGAFAAELMKTPRVTEGPFYPDKLPLDTDNDLLVINDKITPAVGDITHLMGVIRDADGAPMKGVTIEIWQVDNNGAYLHSGTTNRDKRDANFQGYGRFTTDKTGAYYFRTIKPVPYPGRTPHIHYKVKRGNKELLCSQIFISGHEQNAHDGIFLSSGGLLERELVQAEFKPIKDSKIGELEAKFDIVIGKTPDERR
jgi:protocatechuate 3,4-dioxygenase beta subunit